MLSALWPYRLSYISQQWPPFFSENAEENWARPALFHSTSQRKRMKPENVHIMKWSMKAALVLNADTHDPNSAFFNPMN